MDFIADQNQCNSKQENHVACMANLKVTCPLRENTGRKHDESVA